MKQIFNGSFPSFFTLHKEFNTKQGFCLMENWSVAFQHQEFLFLWLTMNMSFWNRPAIGFLPWTGNAITILYLNFILNPQLGWNMWQTPLILFIQMKQREECFHLHQGKRFNAASLDYSILSFLHKNSYSHWIVDKVIGQEVYRNIGFSLTAIFITVLLFLLSLKCSIMVIICLSFTIIEVAGFMHFWGLTLDVISCNTLVVAVGLCVDFSVHIAHRFLASPGDR